MTEPTWTSDDGRVTLYLGDCLDVLPTLAGVDAVVTDPPYGTTACKWDSVIPFEPMWAQLKRVAKKNAAIVLFGSEPFSSALRMSNIKQYKYDWVWDKVNLYTGALLANKRPLKRHENISVFFDELPTYNKQYRDGRPYTMTRNVQGVGEYCTQELSRTKTVNEGRHNPCSVLAIEGDIKREKGFHPTQKPVALLEYLIRTYTNEGETVLDFTMGSGTTGVACVQTGRRFIGIELDAGYFDIAKRRIIAAQQQLSLLSEVT
jgi:site-specific DNA-methyltransferase (adenine-specific)